MKMKKPKSAPRPQFTNTRKVQRKVKRKQKKLHRQEHYLKQKSKSEQPKYTPGRFVKRPAESPELEKEVKPKKPKLQPSFKDVLKKESEKEKKEVNRLNSQMEKQRRQMLLKANEEEDKLIKKLEKHLGLNKAKNKNNYFADDGLDYLLEVCDRGTSEKIVAAEKHLAEMEDGSDFEDDLAAVTGKQLPKDKEKKKRKERVKGNDENKKKSKDKPRNESSSQDESDIGSEQFPSEDEQDLESNMSGDNPESSMDDEDIGSEEFDENYNENSEFGEESDEEVPEEKHSKPITKNKIEEEIKTKNKKDIKYKKEKIVSEEDLCKVFSEDEVSDLSGDEDLSDGNEENSPDALKSDEKEKPDVWEDIYGRKRDKEGNIIKEERGVYIPPHLRNKDMTSDEDMAQINRQIKSVLNKLSGSNLHWACSSIETLYTSHSRHGVSASLWRQCNASMATIAEPPRIVAERAALLAVLHANVANEIGAYFLEELTKKFDELMLKPQPVEDKTLDNLVSNLAYMYCFKIYQASLLYDILYRLLENVTEKNIDCVLGALRVVGGVLRKEEPLALKNFILDTQKKVTGLNDNASQGSRVKFLLEVLMAVKNNNLTKIPNYDPSYVEHLKKQIRGIIRKGNYITPLNIRLEDLLRAEERGKWWIVGSAWEGTNKKEEKPAEKPMPAFDQKLLELARKQRMNTDIRRSIFCVIMSAEDYMDAFEKLNQLGLRGSQQREIVHVLLACCLQERNYNPYYAVLAQKLCDTDRKYQLSIQFATWDKIKELENLSKQSMSNLAQLLVHLILGKGLPLSVLKIIEFSDLNKRTVKFMRQILLAIIMNDDLQSTLEVFHRVSKSSKLHMFRESLRLFIQHFLVKNAGKVTVLSEKEMAILKQRVEEVNKVIMMYESKLRL